MNSQGSSCLPKRTWTETHSIGVYVNNTSFCTSIELEHHRGPCRCECLLDPSSCHARQQFLPDSCSCQCLPSLGSEKSVCSNSSVHRWDSDTCQCTCKHFNTCQTGHSVNTQTCKCQETPYISCSVRSISDDKVHIINLIVLFSGVIIISTTMYWCVIRRRVVDQSPQQLFLQSKANSEENIVINGYTFTLTRGSTVGKLINQELAVQPNLYN